ncbi:hypothetical protein KNO81_19345 [Paraburkholderia sediminicola]|nr:hypothetical protein [Paraburkholderia sediminicola]
MRVSYEPTPFPLAKDVWAEPVRPNGAITDYQLDEYHRELLTASNAIKNLLGSTSVVYWGFYTWSPEIAHIRARRHLMGFRSRLGTSPERIADAFARMDTAASMGEALGALAGFSQLGRTPFASKVCTKRHPERGGVLDTQLFKGLSRSGWAAGAAFLRLGSVADARCQDAYMAWCAVLSSIASQLNAGIDAGLPWHWEDTDGSRRRWRAVDVERAIFKYLLLEKNNVRRLAELQALPEVVSRRKPGCGCEGLHVPA